jgi:two-component system, OmpR family, sensor kinase
MSRLPIRVRLTLAFAVAMALVLVAVGAFLYLRLGSSLDETLSEHLEARAAELAPRVATDSTDFANWGAGSDAILAQVLEPGGRVGDATSNVGRGTLLSPKERERAAQAPIVVERREVPGPGTEVVGYSTIWVDGPVRLLATPVESPNGRHVLVLGVSLEERDEALRGFLGELVIIGPVALLLASLLGFAIGTAALRPVEAMRAEASAISAAEPERRLPVPAARDELARLAHTLNGMLERLQRALERERSFVADASHELRTPLALLKAELELALRRPRSTDELEDALRSAAAETDRLSRLAEDLLILARSDREQLPLQRETVSAQELLDRVADRYRGHAEGTGRSIDVSVPDGLLLNADVLRLEQALGNVLDNALRHGGGAIRLSAVEQNGSVELHVADEGSGFPAQFLPRAFERFTRADAARTGGGAGLGLAIAAVIAKAHGGSAHAANRDGEGADVWLSIPRLPRT